MQVKEGEYFKRFKAFAHSIRAQSAIKIIVCHVVSAALLLTAQTAWAAAQTPVPGTVTRVIDGDTLWVQTSTRSKPLKVRIQAIDAPEICQAGGVAARDALKSRVFGKGVLLFTGARDNYNRTVARVDVQGEDVGSWLVGGGHAWSLGHFQSAGPYASEQLRAQIVRRGIFSGGTPEHPKEFRKRHGSCFSRQ